MYSQSAQFRCCVIETGRRPDLLSCALSSQEIVASYALGGDPDLDVHEDMLLEGGGDGIANYSLHGATHTWNLSQPTNSNK